MLGTTIDASILGIPIQAKLVENELKPKSTLDHVIASAYPSQTRVRKRFKEKLYKELGSHISLKRLSDVPSYQYFVRDLTDTLRTLNMLQQ
jgi:hypothetical protein